MSEPQGNATKEKGSVEKYLSTAPSFSFAALTPFACPACWPLYAGMLGSLGLSVTAITPILLPITILLVAMAVAPLGYRATNRHGYGPLMLGLVAGMVVLVGIFAFGSDPVIFTGAAMMIAASVWNVWPVVNRDGANCPACVVDDSN